ncbi:hypothetical protein N5C54_14795 [Pseudomonas chengduensis]|uniref:hypothetical protein n=1 Tax=Pseudomonas sp. o96-267 TaxID=2479853 RepID=UPI000F77DB2B|nr:MULTISPECIES: hypothetical protein [Pseudomonas]MDH0959048.1 hypothetical protein [Pseudomonas chengduensis]MDV5863646.1 hypothetical protein [Pseudomonas mendocina]
MSNGKDKSGSQGDDFDFDISLDNGDLDKMQSSGPISAEPRSGAGLKDPAASPSGKRGPQANTDIKKLVIGAVVAGVVSISGLGYFAVKFFSKDSASQSSSFASETRNDSGSANGISLNAKEDLDRLKASLGVEPKADSELKLEVADPEGQIADGEADGATKEVVEAGADVGNGVVEGGQAKTAGDSEEKPAGDVSEEEKMYDSLLADVNGTGAAADAGKIDQGAIGRKVDAKRLDTLEGQVLEARTSIGDIKGTVEEIRGQVAELSEILKGNEAHQDEIEQNIKRLTAQVSQLRNQKAPESNKYQQQLAKANSGTRSGSAQPQAASSAALPPPMKPAAAKLPPPAPRKQIIAQSNAPVAPTRQAPAKALADDQYMPAHCKGERVSSNWRVKGVNSQSAYVVREQDRVGMYLKAGVDVPGFGQVQMFDPVNRAVCTTQGLIRR